MWWIGSFAAFGEALSDPRLVASLGVHLAHTAATLANVMAALSTGLFIIRFRRPIAHLIRNQPLSRRLKRRALKENRLDDINDDVIRHRQEVYERETQPVLDFYGEKLVARVDSTQLPYQVLRDILDDFEKLKVPGR